MIQGSEEWLMARCGKATASRVSDVVAKTKNGWGASRDSYMAELVIERLNRKPFERTISRAMQDGIDREPIARAAYEFYRDVEIEPVGFVLHPSISMAGASPDGFVGKDGQVEVKCPQPKKHVENLLSGKIDDEYMAQMQFQMACTGRQWCDYVSFNPDFPEHMKLLIKRVVRDDTKIAILERDIRGFLAELDAKVLALQNHYRARAA